MLVRHHAVQKSTLLSSIKRHALPAALPWLQTLPRCLCPSSNDYASAVKEASAKWIEPSDTPASMDTSLVDRDPGIGVARTDAFGVEERHLGFRFGK